MARTHYCFRPDERFLSPWHLHEAPQVMCHCKLNVMLFYVCAEMTLIFLFSFFFVIACRCLISHLWLFTFISRCAIEFALSSIHITLEESWARAYLATPWNAYLGTLFIHSFTSMLTVTLNSSSNIYDIRGILNFSCVRMQMRITNRSITCLEKHYIAWMYVYQVKTFQLTVCHRFLLQPQKKKRILFCQVLFTLQPFLLYVSILCKSCYCVFIKILICYYLPCMCF